MERNVFDQHQGQFPSVTVSFKLAPNSYLSFEIGTFAPLDT